MVHLARRIKMGSPPHLIFAHHRPAFAKYEDFWYKATLYTSLGLGIYLKYTQKLMNYA